MEKNVDKLDRQVLKRVRETLDNILKDNERLEQFDVTVGNASFSDDEVTFKLNLKIKGAKPQSQKDLETFGEMDNLDLTKIAKLDGKDFSLSGFRRKARSKPYLIQDLKNGGEYIITTEVAKKYFGKREVNA
tara:strand:+ start:111 stop:506 length:396 start_codon:yes stop_codon:yes gene_type:complete